VEFSGVWPYSKEGVATDTGCAHGKRGSPMRRLRIPAGIGMLLGGAMVLALLPLLAARGAPQSGGIGVVPAYHNELPKGPLPATLGPKLFTEPLVQNAYAIAGRIKKILYQQPCYCHCDRSIGHGSLLDCYVSKHASGCDICLRETFYAAQQSSKGKTAAQIRDGINRGDWQNVDTSRYQKYSPAPAK